MHSLGAGCPAGQQGHPGSYLSQQQFLDDPKYSTDEDLPSKLEAYKSEGESRVEGGSGGDMDLEMQMGFCARRGARSCLCLPLLSLAAPQQPPLPLPSTSVGAPNPSPTSSVAPSCLPTTSPRLATSSSVPVLRDGPP